VKSGDANAGGEKVAEIDPILDSITTSSGKTYTTSGDTKITVDGKEGANLSDIGVGMQVSVVSSTEDPKKAASITATTASSAGASMSGKRGGKRPKKGGSE